MLDEKFENIEFQEFKTVSQACVFDFAITKFAFKQCC